MRLQVNGVHLHVQVVGEGQPLLLLHGFTGSMENWRPFFPAWSKQYQLVLVDIIGHGQSDAPPAPERYAMNHAVQDLVSVLAELGIERTSILGYSMGGRLALTFAVYHPERVSALLLESASPGLATAEERRERRARDEALAANIECQGIQAFVRRWENIPLFATQKRLPLEVRRALREQRLQNTVQGLTGSLRGMGTGVQESLWDHLQDMTVPTLLLAGKWDSKFCRIAEVMHERLPDSELSLIPDAGHSVHIEQSLVFTEAILKFLKERKR